MIPLLGAENKQEGGKSNTAKAISQAYIEVQQGRKQTIIGALRALDTPKEVSK